MAELQTLLCEEIPGGRNALLESHRNLQKVASYCSQKYLEESNKKTALEETKKFTTQSLASVAYQINTLASNMLHMLDIQAAQLANMDSSINNIAQTVDIHKEKVARREIGLLTTSKGVSRSHQIVAPTNPERSVKYVRKPIDFAELDDIGHGVKLNAQPNTGTVRRPSAVSTKKSPTVSVDGGSKRDSLKSNGGYGTLRAVKAPTVPQEYTQGSRRLPDMFRVRTNSNSSTESGSLRSNMGYGHGIGGAPQNSGMPPPPPTSIGMPPPPPTDAAPASVPAPPLSASMPPPPPPVIGAPPPPPIVPPGSISSLPSNGGYSTPTVSVDGTAPPPPPPPPGNPAEAYAATSVMDLPPPPPPTSMLSSVPPFDGAGGWNPNLPMPGSAAHVSAETDVGIPPPPPSISMGAEILPPPPPMSPGEESSMDGFSMEPDWAPKTYLEKMVVIYDYSAENTDELNLKEDQIVYVVKKNEDGWYEGVLDGVSGLFPGNYADPISH